MARQNLAMLLGSVAKDPKVARDGQGNKLYAMAYINVARGLREVGDHRKYMKCDNPIIMTRDEAIMEKMEKWKKGDIVGIKGVIASKHIKKSSFCPYCGAKNSFPGALVYINPIFVEKRGHFDTDEECLQFLADHREISNQIYVFGTLCRDPKKITPKQGLVVTQYQIAMNRKFRIATDPVEMTADYPWVKSYGDNAKEDQWRLHIGSEIYIDGCLQARSVQRHAICGQAYDEKGKPMYNEEGEPIILKDKNGKPLGCGEVYDWKDRAMELVPYATEYLNNYYSDEEIEEHKETRRLQRERDLRANVLLNLQSPDDDVIDQNDIDAGYDTMDGED